MISTFTNFFITLNHDSQMIYTLPDTTTDMKLTILGYVMKILSDKVR